MPFDTPNPHPEAVADATPPTVSLHQHMTAGYEGRKALKAEAGFPADMVITPRDLLEAEFARINAAFRKASPNAKPFDGFYKHGGVR